MPVISERSLTMRTHEEGTCMNGDGSGLTLIPRRKSRQIPSSQAAAESFYHLTKGVEGKCCQGTACFAARHLDRGRWNRAIGQAERVYCLGKCYLAPACDSDSLHPHIEVDARVPIILERMVRSPVRTLGEYIDGSGYRAFLEAMTRPAGKITECIEQSGLRGRGGAAFPTGRKWHSVAQQPASAKSIVVNADEGDAGAFIDRFIMENDPHCLIEGMALAGYAVGAQKGVIYVRAEYPRARRIVEQAVNDARRAGFLCNRSNGFYFDIELVCGKGSYLCGEETALLNSIEGKRPVAMARPPYAADRGLFGMPTLINNVETLAAVPWILRNGAEAYQALGFSKSRGTKVISLNSLFRRPGLYEVEFGVTIRHIVEHLGGGLRSGVLKGVMIGGPLAGMIPPDLLDTPFGFEELRSIKASVGHGGIIGFDDNTTIAQLIQHVFSFGSFESCGKCTPCRLGAREIETLFSRILEQRRVEENGRDLFRNIVDALNLSSLCGHGIGLAEFAESIFHHYPEELETCFK